MRAIGYVRGCEKAEVVQKASITAFCTKNNYELLSIFDDTYCKSGDGENNIIVNRRSEVGKMLSCIKNGGVDVLLVDTVMRLYNGKNSEKRILEFCEEFGVTVLEVGNAEYLDTKKRIAVYYKTNYKGCRAGIPLKAIDKLYVYANQLFGNEVLPRLFIEKTYSSYDCYEDMLKSKPEIIISKSFFRLHRRSMVLLKTKKEYSSVRFLCSEDGELIQINTTEMLNKPFKVAIYERARSIYEERNQSITLEKLQTYSALRTMWNIEDIYVDKVNSEDRLRELESNLDKYDLVLADTVAKFGEYTENFVRIFKNSPTMFFSLQEGGYKIDNIYTPK